jgi:hypothetical protein
MKNGVQTNLVQEKIGKGIAQDRAAELYIIPQVRLLQLLIQLRNGNAESITQHAAQKASLLMLAPDRLKFQCGVGLDDLLHLLDVVAVELWYSAVFSDAHVLDKLLVVKRERGQNFQR